MLKTDIAWAAGIIDGEGCITIGKNKGRYYSPMLIVQIREKTVCEKLQSLFGGTITKQTFKNDNWCDCYRWRLSNRQVKHAVDLLLPYLLIKDKQAKLIQQYYSDGSWKTAHHRHNPLPDKTLKARESLYQQVKRLNIRGMAHVN